MKGSYKRQSGRALNYIVGFIALVFLGVITLGYINSQSGSNPESFTAGNLFK